MASPKRFSYWMECSTGKDKEVGIRFQELAYIPWQGKRPYHLYNHHKHCTLSHFPYRISQEAKRLWKEKALGKPLVQRNWEIQFLEKENDQNLRSWLFDNPAFDRLIPKEIVRKYYELFVNDDHVYWSHPVSMLLILSVFARHHQSKID